MDTNIFVPLLVCIIVPPIIALGLWGSPKFEIPKVVKVGGIAVIMSWLLPYVTNFENMRHNLVNLKFALVIIVVWLHTMLWVRIYNRFFKL